MVQSALPTEPQERYDRNFAKKRGIPTDAVPMSPAESRYVCTQHHVNIERREPTEAGGGRSFGCNATRVQSALRRTECDVHSDGISGTSQWHLSAQQFDSHVAGTSIHRFRHIDFQPHRFQKFQPSRWFSTRAVSAAQCFGILFSATNSNCSKSLLFLL